MQVMLPSDSSGHVPIISVRNRYRNVLPCLGNTEISSDSTQWETSALCISIRCEALTVTCTLCKSLTVSMGRDVCSETQSLIRWHQDCHLNMKHHYSRAPSPLQELHTWSVLFTPWSLSPVSLKTLSSGCTTEQRLLSTSVPSLAAVRSDDL